MKKQAQEALRNFVKLSENEIVIGLVAEYDVGDGSFKPAVRFNGAMSGKPGELAEDYEAWIGINGSLKRSRLDLLLGSLVVVKCDGEMATPKGMMRMYSVFVCENKKDVVDAAGQSIPRELRALWGDVFAQDTVSAKPHKAVAEDAYAPLKGESSDEPF